MQLSSLIELLSGSELEKYFLNRKELDIGDKLTGKIIEIKENGKVLIDFLKFRTVAQVKFPVEIGQKISVTVIEKGESLKLSLENKDLNIIINSKEILNNIKNQNNGNIKNLVEFLNDLINKEQKLDKSENITTENKNIEDLKTGNNVTSEKNISNTGQNVIAKNAVLSENVSKMEVPEKISNIIQNLNTQFKPFGPAEDILKISTELKHQIENSGIFFEKRIAAILAKIEQAADSINAKLNIADNVEIKEIIKNDLKPNLLVLKDFFENESSNSGLKLKQLNSIRETIDDLINNISKQHDVAVKKDSNNDTMQYFTFQLPVKDKGKAKLRVYYNKKDKRDPSSKGFNLSLLLIMESLGEIRTDFFLLKKDLNITFYVMNEDIKKNMSEKLGIIRESIVDMFRFLNLSIIVSKRKIREFDNEEIENEQIKMGLVDLSV